MRTSVASRPAARRHYCGPRPSGRFGFCVTTTVDGKNVLEQTIVADGSAQPLSEETAPAHSHHWSRDGERLYDRRRTAQHSDRSVSGITLRERTVCLPQSNLSLECRGGPAATAARATISGATAAVTTAADN